MLKLSPKSTKTEHELCQLIIFLLWKERNRHKYQCMASPIFIIILSEFKKKILVPRYAMSNSKMLFLSSIKQKEPKWIALRKIIKYTFHSTRKKVGSTVDLSHE